MLLGVVPHVAIGLLAWCGLGCGFVLVRVSGLTLVQRLSGDRVLARVLAVLETMFVATIGLGAILAPALVTLLGLEGALIATGAALPLVALARLAAIRRLESGTPVPQRGLSASAPLPRVRAAPARDDRGPRPPDDPARGARRHRHHHRRARRAIASI